MGMTVGPAVFVNQKAADRQYVVANLLGRQAIPRAPTEQPIVGIVDQQLRITRHSRLSVSRRQDNQAAEFLDIPTAFDELAGQPVEQLRMCRRLSLAAEVFGRDNQ